MQDPTIFLSHMLGRMPYIIMTWLSSFNLLSTPVQELLLRFHDLLIFLLAYRLRSSGETINKI